MRKNLLLTSYDKACYNAMIRHTKGWAWLKLNHPTAYRKYKKRYPQIDTMV